MKLSKKILELESEDTKYCTKCKKIKPLFEFGVRLNGHKLSRPTCFECDNKKAKEDTILNDHGITLKDYDKMLEKQNGKCKICGTKTSGGRGRFHIDHDHKTNKIRGLLCHNCNILLGHAKDDIKILAKAITYLTVIKC